MKELLLIGAGGHCKSVIDVINCKKDYVIAGLIDIEENVGKTVFGHKIIGSDKDLANLRDEYRYALIAIGEIGVAKKRARLYQILKSLNFELPTVISPYSYISRYANIEEGTVIMHDVVVNADAEIGKNCIINTKSLIEHDTVIEDNCHISTGAIINGGVVVGKNSYIGSGSIIIQGAKIPENSFIKAGSIVK